VAADLQLSIVIPTYNRYERAARTVTALADQIVADGLSGDVEVIVVDDGSERACAAELRAFILRQNQPFLRLLELAQNQGASAARNAGARSSLGAILAFLDDDIVPADGYVGAIIRSHRQHPEALVINGNLRQLQPSVYADFWFHYYDATFNRHGESFFPVRMLASGNVSLKRSLLARFDPLFDTSLTSREDLDLFIRLKEHGIPSHKDDSILAFIDCRNTLTGFLKQRLWYSRGHQQLIAKHGKAVVQAQAMAPRNYRFLHLYILLRVTQAGARWHAAFRRMVR
jgi:glycosyltransferase involved in cell wall biosynthesis